MARKVKHFSLHRIDGTELRVVSDVEDGVLPIVQAEEDVIRGYMARGQWPHQCVTLFVLQDLEPLIRQIQPAAGASAQQAEILDGRPVVNVYDLANPSTCQVFINREAMSQAGYWDDPLAVRGLLAHEHAHPVSENETTGASRGLRLKLATTLRPEFGQWTGVKEDVVRGLVTGLAHKLCLYAPREVFANETTIRSGFGEGLLHLDRQNMESVRAGLAGRETLKRQFLRNVGRGELSPEGAELLLVIGDFQNYTELALEIAPFYRAGRDSEAHELESVLTGTVFPQVEPGVARVYSDLVKHYVSLPPDLKRSELLKWGNAVLGIFAKALSDKGLGVIADCREV